MEIRNVDIVGFNVGAVTVTLGASGTLLMSNCTLTNNGSNGANAYVKVSTTSGFAIVTISNCTFQGNNGNGVVAGNNAFVGITNSIFQSFANGAQTTGNGSLTADSSFFFGNTNSLNAAAGTTINVINNTLQGTTAFGGAGSYVSAGNNKIVNSAQGANPTQMLIK